MPAYPNTKLFLSSHFESHWQEIIQPWIEAHSKASWQTPKPTVVLVPSQGYAFFLRSQLIERGMQYVGIFFWTPRDCRTHLLSHTSHAPLILKRENLEFLLATLAEKNSLSPAFSAVSKDPSQLIKCLEQLASAGWDWDKNIDPILASLLSSFSNLFKADKIQTIQQADHWLIKKAKKQAPTIESCLSVGFDATHWSLWPLLNAMICTSSNATICLNLPRYRAENLDQIWINSWEENYGSASPVADTISHSEALIHLVERMES